MKKRKKRRKKKKQRKTSRRIDEIVVYPNTQMKRVRMNMIQKRVRTMMRIGMNAVRSVKRYMSMVPFIF